MRRVLSLVLLAATVAPVLTACSPLPIGATGITVDADGNLVATFFWCTDNPPDGAHLHEVDNWGGGDPIARYAAPRLTGYSSDLRIDEPTGGWTLEGDTPVLRPGTRYEIYGWTSDASTTLAGVVFTVEERRRLAPGQVLIQEHDEHRDAEVDVVLTRPDFRAEVHWDYCEPA